MAKRTYNPKTKQFYEIRERTTSKGKKGQIVGAITNSFSRISKKRVGQKISKRYGSAIRRLSDT